MPETTKIAQLIPLNKVTPPRLRPNRLHRAELVRQLEENLWRKLTLLCAPAGYGKTTLINEWAQVTRSTVCWLQLDDEDNIPHRFLSSFIISIRRQFPTFSELFSPILHQAHLPPSDQLARLLLHEIETIPQPFVIVLDDYHLIHQMEIHTLMKDLVSYLPANAHLLIASREEPPLPLARMRAKDEVGEIRMSDLQFHPDEAIAFCNEVMNLHLDQHQLDTLLEKTEGWPAGMQLAALSLRDVTDRHDFIDSFAGTNRFILDFLMEEVLDRLDSNTRKFLLRIAILDKVNPPLSAILADGIPNPPSLVDLESDNLFISSIDPERTWFRFHPLFADLLRLRLREEEGEEEISRLFQVAAEWEEANELYPESVQHYIRAGNFQQAGTIAHVYASILLSQGETVRCTTWLGHLPAEVTESSLALQLVYGYGMISNSQFSEAAHHAETAQQLFDQVSAYLPEEQRLNIQAHIHAIFALVASENGNIVDTLRYCDLAIPHLENTDPVRTSLWLGMSVVYHSNNRILDSMECLRRAIVESTLPDQNGIRLVALNNLAMLYYEIGNFAEAESIGRSSLTRGDPAIPETDPIVAIAYLYLGVNAYENDDLEKVDELNQKGLEFAKKWGNIDVLTNLYNQRVLLHLARHQPDEAREVFRRYGELAATVPTTQITHDRYLTGCLRYYLLAGEYPSARNLLKKEFSTFHRPTEFLMDALWFERAVAELWLDHSLQDITREKLIEVQAHSTQNGRRVLQILSSLLLYALHHAGSTEISDMLALSRLMRECQEIGLFRSLVDLLPILRPVFTTAIRGVDPELSGYLQRILNASNEPLPKGGGPPPANKADLLSDRELEVLRLLTQGLSNAVMAERLFVSTGTIKRHLHNIYAKLGADSRLDAMTRARAQGYL